MEAETQKEPLKSITTSNLIVLIRGGGDLASGVAWRLHQSGFKVMITEIAEPLSVRRKVSFCEAVHDGTATVEGVKGVRIEKPEEAERIWDAGTIPVIVDPDCKSKTAIRPDVLVDATIAKKNLGIAISDATLVIALGPGFAAGKDAHFVVETNRGHFLGRLLEKGTAEPNTGIPGPVMGITEDRVVRASADGIWESPLEIGDTVQAGEVIGNVAGVPVNAKISGILRGLIRQGCRVSKGLKIGDIDPRGYKDFCTTISEKALAIAGGVLEGILRTFAC